MSAAPCAPAPFRCVPSRRQPPEMIGDVSGSDRRRLLRDGDRPSSCNDAAHAPALPATPNRCIVAPRVAPGGGGGGAAGPARKNEPPDAHACAPGGRGLGPYFFSVFSFFFMGVTRASQARDNLTARKSGSFSKTLRRRETIPSASDSILANFEIS